MNSLKQNIFGGNVLHIVRESYLCLGETLRYTKIGLYIHIKR